MKRKTIKIYCAIFGFIIVSLLIFYMYDMHNGKVKNISVYDELAYTGVFDGEFETTMNNFFENSNLERQVEPISTPQEAKKIAQKTIYELYGLKRMIMYRPYSVYYDDEMKIWYVYAEPFVQKVFPFICGACCSFLVTDDGYIVSIIMW